MADQRAELRRRIDKAHQMVADLCSGKQRWIMRIPAEPDRDPDLVITDGLLAAKEALDFQAALEARVAALEAYDLHCEKFIAASPNVRGYDLCIKWGRKVNAEYADDEACWPCMIRVALAVTPPPNAAATPEEP